MLFLPQTNRLVNCYNNGKIALWNTANLGSDSQPLLYAKIHDSFAYKIRQMDS